MAQDDLIDFDIIETQKENIQSLPSGRSAKALASLFSPVSKGKAPSPSQTQNLNDAMRQEYEKEILNISDSDDPLDVYDRYVKWTLDAYPTAQATPQSQLLPLLERATKAFLTSNHYKNDPRYLRLWFHYIRLFSDAPRETFAFLARHNIGDGLALFYEEFAAWLENAGRWTQAEEVYKLGLDREARPTERLLRKYAEFQHRFDARPQDVEEPKSPALPTVRPALAAKIDPFAHASAASSDPQARPQPSTTAASKLGRQKLAIFSDSEAPSMPASSAGAKGWDNIESIKDRKKENTVEAKPWAGETLKTTKRNTGVSKMMIFKDQTKSNDLIEPNPLRNARTTVNERTGRTECVFVNLEAIYPDNDPSASEYCFEELRARHRGWLDYDWAALRRNEQERKHSGAQKATVTSHIEAHQVQTVPVNLDPHCSDSENIPPDQADDRQKPTDRARRDRKEDRANRTRKIKVMEVKQETQTVMTNLDSPTGPKIKRKKSAEPTVTIHTREAMDEIYGIFNQPLQSAKDPMEAEESEEETDDDDDYTSAGESTETGRMSATTSEFGDMTTADFTTQSAAPLDHSENDDSDEEPDEGRSASKWSDFTASKHIPKSEVGSEDRENREDTQEELSEVDSVSEPEEKSKESPDEELMTPTSPPPDLVGEGSKFVPLPPEHCEIPTHPYRDPQYVAQSRLPFMTPIVEKTETSIGAATALAKLAKDYFNPKTPCRETSISTPTKPRSPGAEGWSSPFVDDLDAVVAPKVPQPILKKGPVTVLAPRPKEQASKPPALPKGPIIQDVQCNPIDDQIRNVIISQIQPPISSYEGYFDRSSESHGKGADIRKFAKSLPKSAKGGSDKTTGNLVMPPVLRFEGSERQYVIKRELGKGAFAPVYLAESEDVTKEVKENEDEPAVEMGKGAFGVQRAGLEAIKMENPPSVWEFYMLRQAKRRLGVSRAMDSIVPAYEMHLFKDECYLIEQYSDQGTLLDLVNLARADSTSGGVMDEQVVMFFTIELFRTVEALHSKGLLHGDIKADNLLVRFKNIANEDGWSSLYHRDGTNGWSEKGTTLIDFGRGIDMKAFKPDVQFIADWKTSEADCAEMREMRPWTYQIDYHGVASVVHTLLFGKYIETVAERGAILGAGQTKTYKIRESLKRYWQTEIWGEVFDLMLNPLMHLEGEEGTKLPVLKGMRRCREKMETWLEANCEKGVGLKALLRRLEVSIKERKR